MKPRRNTQTLPLEKHARKDCFFESAKHWRHLLERKFLGYGASKHHVLSPMHDDADAHHVKHCTRRKHCNDNYVASVELKWRFVAPSFPSIALKLHSTLARNMIKMITCPSLGGGKQAGRNH